MYMSRDCMGYPTCYPTWRQYLFFLVIRHKIINGYPTIWFLNVGINMCCPTWWPKRHQTCIILLVNCSSQNLKREPDTNHKSWFLNVWIDMCYPTRLSARHHSCIIFLLNWVSITKPSSGTRHWPYNSWHDINHTLYFCDGDTTRPDTTSTIHYIFGNLDAHHKKLLHRAPDADQKIRFQNVGIYPIWLSTSHQPRLIGVSVRCLWDNFVS